MEPDWSKCFFLLLLKTNSGFISPLRPTLTTLYLINQTDQSSHPSHITQFGVRNASMELSSTLSSDPVSICAI